MNREPLNPRTLRRREPRSADTANQPSSEVRDPVDTEHDMAAAAAGLRAALDKHHTDRMNFPINIGIAVAILGLSIALGFLLPLPAYKALVGIAGVVAVVTIGTMVHRRFGRPQAPVVEETEVDTAS